MESGSGSHRETAYKTPARRDFAEGKLALHLRGELLGSLDGDAAAASGGKLFGKVNVLWHGSSMCLSPYLSRVHVLRAADFELDADKKPTDSCKALFGFLGRGWRSRGIGSSTESGACVA